MRLLSITLMPSFTSPFHIVVTHETNEERKNTNNRCCRSIQPLNASNVMSLYILKKTFRLWWEWNANKWQLIPFYWRRHLKLKMKESRKKERSCQWNEHSFCNIHWLRRENERTHQVWLRVELLPYHFAPKQRFNAPRFCFSLSFLWCCQSCYYCCCCCSFTHYVCDHHSFYSFSCIQARTGKHEQQAMGTDIYLIEKALFRCNHCANVRRILWNYFLNFGNFNEIDINEKGIFTHTRTGKHWMMGSPILLFCSLQFSALLLSFPFHFKQFKKKWRGIVHGIEIQWFQRSNVPSVAVGCNERYSFSTIECVHLKFQLTFFPYASRWVVGNYYHVLDSIWSWDIHNDGRWWWRWRVMKGSIL